MSRDFSPGQPGAHPVPATWLHLLEDLDALRLPREGVATCQSCLGVAAGLCRDDVRCCGYLPVMPNFLLGLALGDPATRAAVIPVVERGNALPHGLHPTPAQFRAALQTNASGRFGEVAASACPFLTRPDHGCAVHAYRNSVCATYFCEHDHGAAGRAYWAAIQALVGLSETVIGQWAMDRVGLDCAVYFSRLDSLANDVEALSAPGEAGWSLTARQALWGPWLGREVAFFEACAAEVTARREDLHRIASGRPLWEARVLERAVLEWLPPALREEAPGPSRGEPVPVEDLWYRVQLEARRLWDLPFGEGPVALAPGARIVANPGKDPVERLRGGWPYRVGQGDQRLFLTDAETRALRLFESPRALDEALFERPEVRALDDPRDFLSRCMRRGILVTANGA